MKFFNFIDHTPDTISQGHVPQRPGPKPKTEPAQSRRQEMNRQAQRLHRSRQIAYVKQLEAEVQRLRKGYLDVCQERDQYKLMYENADKRLMSEQQMSDFMFNNNRMNKRHHMATPPQNYDTNEACSLIVSPVSLYSDIVDVDVDLDDTNNGISPTGSDHLNSIITHHHDTNNDFALVSGSGPSSQTDLSSSRNSCRNSSTNSSIDFESNSGSETDTQLNLGVDFVLAMERQCMDHLHPLNPDGTNPFRSKDVIDGHAMMISWNRYSNKFIEVPPEIALAASNCSRTRQRIIGDDTCVKQQTEVNSLASLLNLSSKLSLSETEMTPVSAWFFMSKHPKFKYMDHQKLKHYLADHTKCLGFGAVINKGIVEGVLESGI